MNNAKKNLESKAKDIINFFRAASAGLLDRFPCCVAGGGVVEYIRKGKIKEKGDIDVFLYDGKKYADTIAQWLNICGYSVAHRSDHADLFTRNTDFIGNGMANKIHIVYTKPAMTKGILKERGSVEEVLNGFDISSSMIGVEKDRLIVSGRFLESLGSGVTSVEKTSTSDDMCRYFLWPATLLRIVKYAAEKYFYKLDNTFFDLLDMASESVDPSGKDNMENFIDIMKKLCWNDFLDINNNQELAEAGYLVFSTTTPVIDEPDRSPWRTKYLYLDKNFAVFANSLKEIFFDNVFFGPIMVYLAKMVIDSGLKFPVELLEKEHRSFISEAFCRELAWVISLESGSCVKNFTKPYAVEKHYGFPNFSPRTDIKTNNDRTGMKKSVDMLFSPVPPESRTNFLFKHSNCLISSLVNDVENLARSVEQGEREHLEPLSKMLDTVEKKSFFDIDSGNENIIMCSLADAAFLGLRDREFYMLVKYGARPGKEFLSLAENVRNKMEAAMNRCVSSKTHAYGVLAKRHEVICSMIDFAIESGYPERNEAYSSARNLAMENGSFFSEFHDNGRDSSIFGSVADEYGDISAFAGI